MRPSRASTALLLGAICSPLNSCAISVTPMAHGACSEPVVFFAEADPDDDPTMHLPTGDVHTPTLLVAKVQADGRVTELWGGLGGDDDAVIYLTLVEVEE